MSDTVISRYIISRATTEGESLPKTVNSALTSGHRYEFREITSNNLPAINVTEFFAQTSKASGGMIVLDPHVACMPYLRGSDGQPVFLFQLIEVIDEYLDCDKLKQEFPTLSYGQMAGAIAFLRKLSQFNTRNIDIESLEHADLEASPDFQSMMEQLLADQEETLVQSVK